MKTSFFPLSLCLCILSTVSAQDHTPELDNRVIKTLEEVLIGRKISFIPFKAPVTFQVLSGADLKARSVGQEPSFLLAETPSVTNYSDGGNAQGYSYFRLRGIDQTRINMTLDGAPMNEPEDQGAYFSNYPDLFNSLSGVLITRGVGTSRHGVASYGGSIGLFAPDFTDSAKTTVGFGYGSFNSYRVFGEYNSGKRRIPLYVRASQVASDGYKYHASNNSQSVFLSTGFFNKKMEWKINALVGQQRNKLAWLGVSDSLISIDRRTNLNENEKDRFFQSFVQLQNKYLFQNSYNSPRLNSSVYYTFLDGNYDFNMNSFLGLPGTDELYNYALRSNLLGAYVNYERSFDILDVRDMVDVSVGVHANTYQRRHIGSEQELGELYRNRGYKNELSGFAKLQVTFLRLTLLGDLQFRHVDFDYAGSVAFQKLNWNFLNPKLGWSYRIKNKSQLYYSIGKVGREPTRNDLFGGNDNLLADSLGKPLIFNQTPEYVIDQELGFRYLKQKTSVNVNLYYMDFKNEIVLDGKFGPNGLALTNKVDKSFRTGIEASIRFQFFRNFSSLTNASYNYSRIKEQSVSFTPILTPPVIVNQEFTYTLKAFSVSVSGRYQDASYIDFANTAQVKGYFLLNARLGYRVKGFDFGVFINNLTNTRYYSNGYVDYDGSRKYFVQAPANFYGSVKYSF